MNKFQIIITTIIITLLCVVIIIHLPEEILFFIQFGGHALFFVPYKFLFW